MIVAPLMSATSLLIAITAFGYTLSTIGMKIIVTQGGPIGWVLLSLGLGTFIVAEIELLRQTNLAIAYIAIMAAETLLVIGYSATIGEFFSLRQALGAGMVLIGIVTLTASSA